MTTTNSIDGAKLFYSKANLDYYMFSFILIETIGSCMEFYSQFWI